MKFAVIGVHYESSNLNQRSYASFTDTEKLNIYNDLFAQGLPQSMIVSTCNRSEIYFFYEDDSQIPMVKQCFLTHSDNSLLDHIQVKKGEKALIYFMEVCCGYHSMALGEDQILHQMQEAYAFANQAQACGKQMHQVMQRTFSSVKYLKTQYHMSEVSLSIASLTMQIIRNYPHPIKKVLLIGSGDMIFSLLPYLQEKNDLQVYLCSRSYTHAQERIHTYSFTWLPFYDRYTISDTCDVIISATSSPHIVYKRQQEMTIPQLLIDLAAPRDIDFNSLAACQTYVDLDQLQGQADENRNERMKRLQSAHDDLLSKAQTLHQWILQSRLDPMIENIQQKSERMAQDTFVLLQRKLSLSKHEESILQHILQNAFLRLSREPIRMIKQLSNDHATLDSLTALFNQEDIT